MAKVITTENRNAPLLKFQYSDNDHTPSWLRGVDGRASLHVSTHTANPWLSFDAYEASDKASKRTIITMDAEQGRAFYQWLKALYEPENS